MSLQCLILTAIQALLSDFLTLNSVYNVYCSLLCNVIAVSIKNDFYNWWENPKEARCLTGYMTDLQSWVDEVGHLINVNEEISNMLVEVMDVRCTACLLRQAIRYLLFRLDMKAIGKEFILAGRVCPFEYVPRVAVYMARSAIDLSTRIDPVASLLSELSSPRRDGFRRILYLSLARCKLTQIPPIFHSDTIGQRLADTTEYISFYGNNFAMVTTNHDKYEIMMNASKAQVLVSDDEFLRQKMSSWSFGFQDVRFPHLKELDLRACSIQVLGDFNFGGMPILTSLYLSENKIYYINANTFKNLNNLKHLDLSRNYRLDENGILSRLEFETIDVLQETNLVSLDLSFTRLNERNVPVITRIGKSLQRLSVCYSGLNKFRNNVFKGTSLRYLDITGNVEALASVDALKGTENTLQVLYAEEITLRSLKPFENFTKLEVLRIPRNNIRSITKNEVVTLKNLQILDLDNNRLSAWFEPYVSYLPHLKILSVRNNNINVISREMVEDMQKISYVSFSGNFIVCNCHARDFYDIALQNELMNENTYVKGKSNDKYQLFHNGYNDYNKLIRKRANISQICLLRGDCVSENNTDVGNFLILDYKEALYHCLSIPESVTLKYSDVPTCNQLTRDLETDDIIRKGWTKIFLIILVPTILVPISLFLYSFRKNFKYFLITMRNSAMLTLINKQDNHDENLIYNYDVFVSYCNEDRAWVLDHLLPHLENDCNISVCLHERDFQVGLSILENIVSCMDRSRLIMLILSKQFLLSQWCQFEMHLAQHRLLETRREDLILILLEDIPRRLRPNTLHYLMMTKTYIVWPKHESEQAIFWRRMKKSLVTHKLKETEQNVSLA